MKKTTTLAILAFTAFPLSFGVNATTAQQTELRPASQSIPFQGREAALKSYFQAPQMDLAEAIPNHLTGIHVAAASQPATLQIATKAKAADNKTAIQQPANWQLPENLNSAKRNTVKPAGTDVNQVQYVQGQETAQVQPIQGQISNAPISQAPISEAPPAPAPVMNVPEPTNIAKPTPQNSNFIAPEPYAVEATVVETPTVEAINSPGYPEPYTQIEASQATTLDPYAAGNRNAPAWTPKANPMRHVSDRFSPGGEPFAYSVGRANPNFFGVNRECACDEWDGFCNCGGLKFNRGHLGIPALRSNDNCEPIQQRRVTLKVKQPCTTSQPCTTCTSQTRTGDCSQCNK
jgi:hypothetical protein